MLKTDFKADVFEGNRKYRITTGANEVSEIVEVTEFVQEGDIFTPEHINATNKAINRINNVAEVTLTAAGWSSTAPYTQTVNMAGITENDRPIVSLYLPAGITAENVKLQSKAYDCVNRATTGVGNITVYCYNKKPAVDFQIQVKGVL